MASTPCSVCDEEIEIAGRLRLGQKITCGHCGAQLEVVATAPLEVDIAQEDDDNWEDDDLDEEEDDSDLDDDTEEDDLELEDNDDFDEDSDEFDLGDDDDNRWG